MLCSTSVRWWSTRGGHGSAQRLPPDCMASRRTLSVRKNIREESDQQGELEQTRVIRSGSDLQSKNSRRKQWTLRGTSSHHYSVPQALRFKHFIDYQLNTNRFICLVFQCKHLTSLKDAFIREAKRLEDIKYCLPLKTINMNLICCLKQERNLE